MGGWRADLAEEEVSVPVILFSRSGCRMLNIRISSGTVPSQSEWEELFSDGRIGWDDKGVRRRYLGC